MSNPIQYDPLLVRYLAAELDARLRNRACAGVPHLGDDLSVVLPFDGGEALRLDLHPRRGWIRIVPWPDEPLDDAMTCTGVAAPPDERILRIELASRERFQPTTRTLVVELHTNQWNALLLSEDDRILNALRPRRAGERMLRPGHAYGPPPAAGRYGAADVPRDEALDRWRAELRERAPGDRRGRLIRVFAWTGTVNADAILGEAGRVESDAALREAFARWWGLRVIPPARPVVLRGPRGAQPYPVPLEGTTSESAGSLLEAMARVSESPEPVTPREDESAARAAWLERRRDAASRRLEAIREQLAHVGKADRYRGWGDLLLAHLYRVEKGAESVRLPGWDGGEVEIPLDPARSPAENAERWYREARRLSRAEAKLPELEAEALRDVERYEAALEALRAGEEPPWVGREMERDLRTAAQSSAGANEALPSYRRYRTSGGIEVRVGRSSRDNDRLTFGESAPNEIWLHARSVPGSHVILRWRDPDASPPARDLAEAATLAAWFSKARSSGLVPVDWTRRKYVRKPRGAPPGAVIPQRVKTVFVEPDAEMEERLRDG